MLILLAIQTRTFITPTTLGETPLPTIASGISIGGSTSSSRKKTVVAAAVGATVGAALLIVIIGAILLRRRSTPGQTMSLDFFLGFGAMKLKDAGNDEKSATKSKDKQMDGVSEASGSIRSEPLPTYSEVMDGGEKNVVEERNKKNFSIDVDEECASHV
jgi:hypothetical protein